MNHYDTIGFDPSPYYGSTVYVPDGFLGWGLNNQGILPPPGGVRVSQVRVLLPHQLRVKKARTRHVHNEENHTVGHNGNMA